MEGYLWKRSDFLKNWNRRYCRLNTSTFSYYASHSIPLNDPIRSFSLADALIAPSDKEFARPFTFLLRTKDGSNLYFAAENESSFLAWLENLSICISAASYQHLQQNIVMTQNSHAEVQANKIDHSHAAVQASQASLNRQAPVDATDPLSFLLQDESPRIAEATAMATKDSSPKKSNPQPRKKIDTNLQKHYHDNSNTQVKSFSSSTLGKFHFATDSVTSLSNNISAEQGANDTISPKLEVSGNSMRDAIKENDFAKVQKLVEESSKMGIDLVTCKDSQGETMLHIASVLGRNDIALFLVSHGANPYEKNKYNESSLDVAAPVLAMQMKKAYQEGEESKSSSN